MSVLKRLASSTGSLCFLLVWLSARAVCMVVVYIFRRCYKSCNMLPPLYEANEAGTYNHSVPGLSFVDLEVIFKSRLQHSKCFCFQVFDDSMMIRPKLQGRSSRKIWIIWRRTTTNNCEEVALLRIIMISLLHSKQLHITYYKILKNVNQYHFLNQREIFTICI